MENNMTVRTETMPTTRCGARPAPVNQLRPYPAYDEKQTGKLIDEVIAAAKDDRMNTKRSISADIAATARVQNQNERVIEAIKSVKKISAVTSSEQVETTETIWIPSRREYCKANPLEKSGVMYDGTFDGTLLT